MRSKPRVVPLVLLLALGAHACSEDSPGGEELVRPAEREAAPVSEPGLERTEAERREERLEHFGVDEPEPGETPELE